MTKEIAQFGALLFSDERTASKEARTLLRASGVSFEEIAQKPINGYVAPTLISLDGEFEGLDRIREFIELARTRSELST